MAIIITKQMTGEAREGTTGVAGLKWDMSCLEPLGMVCFFFSFFTYSLSTKYLFRFRTTVCGNDKWPPPDAISSSSNRGLRHIASRALVWFFSLLYLLILWSYYTYHLINFNMLNLLKYMLNFLIILICLYLLIWSYYAYHIINFNLLKYMLNLLLVLNCLYPLIWNYYAYHIINLICLIYLSICWIFLMYLIDLLSLIQW